MLLPVFIARARCVLPLFAIAVGLLTVHATGGLTTEFSEIQQDAGGDELPLAPVLTYVLPDVCQVHSFEFKNTVEHPVFKRLVERKAVAAIGYHLRALGHVGDQEQIERVVIAYLKPQDAYSSPDSRSYRIIRTSEPINDRRAFAWSVVTGAGVMFYGDDGKGLFGADRALPIETNLESHRYWRSGDEELFVNAAYFVDARTVVVAEHALLRELIPQLANPPRPPEGSLAARLQPDDLAGTNAFVVALDLMPAYVNRLQFTHLKPELRELAGFLPQVSLIKQRYDLNSADRPLFQLSLTLRNEQSAQRLAEVLPAQMPAIISELLGPEFFSILSQPGDSLRQGLSGDLRFTQVNETVVVTTSDPVEWQNKLMDFVESLESLETDVDGNAVFPENDAARSEDSGPQASAWEQLFPRTWEERAQAMREAFRNLESHVDLLGYYPRAIPWQDSRDQPAMSWRAYLWETETFHALFSQDGEWWNDDANKAILETTPEFLMTVPTVPSGKSNLLSPYGEWSAFGRVGDKITRDDLNDGAGDVVWLIEVAPASAVSWTKQIDFEFDPEAENPDWPEFGFADEPFVLVGTLDGRIHRVRKEIGQGEWNRLFHRADGKDVDWSSLEFGAADSDEDPQED